MTYHVNFVMFSRMTEAAMKDIHGGRVDLTSDGAQ
ncbi:hypothetical protein I656_03704 [Geobacillus sp. WSUCF1]|nr:hypothetical protein I656_03704 [Geobacillus sp. WSUCF1]